MREPGPSASRSSKGHLKKHLMNSLRPILSASCVVMLFCGLLPAEDAVRIDAPSGGAFGWLTKNYRTRTVPPINLANSNRLSALIRGGNLYLSAEDVIALGLENNLDIEIQRYGPLLNK